MDDLKTQKPREREGWYWSSSEDGPCHGPFESHEAAARAMWDDGFGRDKYNDLLLELGGDSEPTEEEFLRDCELIFLAGKGPISTSVFNADLVLDEFEEKNEESVWSESPPEWPDGNATLELENMLADALYRWAEKHDVWKQFRSLS